MISLLATSSTSQVFHEAPKILTCSSFQTVKRTLSTKPPLQPKGIDKEAEREIAGRKLQARPEEVTTTSTVRKALETSQPEGSRPDVDVMETLKDDIDTIKETIALKKVPYHASLLGLAGTIPYFGTSLSTMYLSWNLNTQWQPSNYLFNMVFLDHDIARAWLQVLEPIQIGYGAVIISFLGAIHWGLEFAEKGAQTSSAEEEERRRFRYGLGVAAPAVAWPTIFMPVEWALTTQFAAFTALYFADTRATVRGWAPPWYSSYRFLLTAIVGSAIVASLVGRAKVGEGATRLSSEQLRERLLTPAHEKGSEGRDWAREEAQERERLNREKRAKEERARKAKEEENKRKQEEEAKGKEEEEGGGGEQKRQAKSKGPDSAGVKDEQKETAGAKEGGKTEDKLEETEGSGSK
ncbi:hypothetical protein VTK26DRAFT_4696 [Humicola hyalothermophila]